MNNQKAPQAAISQEQFVMTSAQCYLQLERYKLKTNIIGINIHKDVINHCYEALERRMTERYSKIYQKILQSVKNIEKNFVIAQANSIRTLNNILRNYRRRVGILSNEPLSNFKYNKYDKHQKILLQSLIYNQKDQFSSILQFKDDLARSMGEGAKEIQDKYRYNEKIKQDSSKILDIIDKTQCYTYRYYEHFQRAMLTTANSLESNFDKLNGYLSVWENVGSTKAYELKSVKQIELQQKHQNQKNRRFFEEQSEEQLQELMNNCPSHSPQREEYRKRLNDLRRYNNQKQKKLQMVGKMFNKRRNRAGILVNKNKQITVLEWYTNFDNLKVAYSYQDQFKGYNADNEHSDYRLTNYQTQKPFKKAEDMRNHMEKYYTGPTLNFQWWYDRFGKDGMFDLINTNSHQIQKRVEFEVVRQTELQNSDDRRKRELLEKQSYQVKQNERRQSLHIGFRHIHDKTELEWLTERSYNTEYIPQLFNEQESSDISFSDDEDSIQEIHHTTKVTSKGKKEAVKERQIIQEVPFIKIKNQQAIQLPGTAPVEVQNQQPFVELEEQIVNIYFKEYSNKILRKQTQPQCKKTIFLYFNSIQDIVWLELTKNMQFQKMFVMTKTTIFFFNRIFSAKQQKIKCILYTLQDTIDEEAIRHKISQIFYQLALVTVKFQPIYTQLQQDQIISFMVGLMIVLLRQGHMPQDYQNKDYIAEGKEIVEDFNCYFYPQQSNAAKSSYMRKFKPIKSNYYFMPSKKIQKKEEKAKDNQTVMSKNTATSKATAQSNIKPDLHKQIQIESNTISNINPYQESTLNSYKKQDEVILKRSNSRQFLQSGALGMQLQSINAELQASVQNQNDYDEL